MITVDFIGLALTACMIGLRYPHLIVAAVVIHELGRLVIAAFFHGHVDSIIVSGVFGATSVREFSKGIKAVAIAFAGPVANYVASSVAGGVEWEKTKDLVNPFALLRYPFAVINLRFAAISLLVNTLRLFY